VVMACRNMNSHAATVQILFFSMCQRGSIISTSLAWTPQRLLKSLIIGLWFWCLIIWHLNTLSTLGLIILMHLILPLGRGRAPSSHHHHPSPWGSPTTHLRMKKMKNKRVEMEMAMLMIRLRISSEGSMNSWECKAACSCWSIKRCDCKEKNDFCACAPQLDDDQQV